MLQVRDLTLTHTRDLRTLAEKFSFTLNEEDKAVLIGEEGNGKSTLLKWLYDPALIEGYCQWSGQLVGDRAAMGYLAQELTAEERELSLYQFCCESPAFLDLSPRELMERGWLTDTADSAAQAPAAETEQEAEGMETELSFPVEEYFSDRPVGTLSGGERIKLQLSRLLFARPRVLLLDEPSSDLDLETLRWLEQFINSYQGILLYISHDETLIENTANLILHMEHPREGKPPRCTVHRSGYRDYVRRREGALAYQTQQARKEREEYEAKMERFRRIQQGVEHDQNAVSRQDPHSGRLLKKKMHAVQSLGRRFEREAAEMTALPEVEEAVFLRFSPDIALPAGKTVLDLRLDELTAGDRVLARDLRLHVSGGEKVGILGRNGAGKTTLLRQIAAQLLERRDLKAAYMSQDYAETLPLDQTPVDYLAPSGHRDDVTRARTFLGSIRFAREEMFHPIRALSGGQKAKLLLTRMMLEGSDVLVLDEPTRNFSPLSGPRVREVLRSYGGSIIAVSHDRKFLTEVCDKLYTFTESGLVLTEKEDVAI